MELPEDVRFILRRLGAGYAVGGCVRDGLCGRVPHDWDFCTPLPPAAVRERFSEFSVLTTGEKHGTVTLLLHGAPYEITTYRVEGAYSDGRHPDSVAFTDRIEEDLARRDFTVNAMAYAEERGLVDPFGGREDLKDGILRCVGSPEERFREDALRILRGLRFAARFGFTIEANTAAAMRTCAPLLKRLSAERVYGELCGILSGNCRTILTEYASVLAVILPEIEPAIGFEQHNEHHVYTVWEHTAAAVGAAEPDLSVRLTMLLHDLGKPATFTLGQDGVGHFYGHAQKSASIADAFFARMKADRATRERVVRLVKLHDTPILPEKKTVRRYLARLGEEDFLRLLAVKRADTAALAPAYAVREGEFREIERIFRELKEEAACFALKDLSVDGNDVKALGFRGREIGDALAFLLDGVLDERFPNEREALLQAARERKEEK